MPIRAVITKRNGMPSLQMSMKQEPIEEIRSSLQTIDALDKEGMALLNTKLFDVWLKAIKAQSRGQKSEYSVQRSLWPFGSEDRANLGLWKAKVDGAKELLDSLVPKSMKS
jgi:hypothetical protein